LEDVLEVTKTIRGEHSDKLNTILVNDGEKLMEAWDQCNG
jgi:hypothetical protein